MTQTKHNLKSLYIYTDGGARGNPGPAASAFVVKDEDNGVIFKGSKFLGVATNNVAEYSAVILALKWLLENLNSIEFENAFLIVDSELVAKQVNGFYRIKNKKLIKLSAKVFSLRKKINRKVCFIYKERSLNKEADLLVNRTLDSVT